MFCLLVSFPTQTLFPGWCANKSYVIATSDLWLFIDASNLLPTLPTLLPYTSFPVEFSTLSEKGCCVCVPGVECRGMYREREGVGGGGGEAWESPLRGGAMGWVVEKRTKFVVESIVYLIIAVSEWRVGTGQHVIVCEVYNYLLGDNSSLQY